MQTKSIIFSVVTALILLVFSFVIFEPGAIRSASDNDQITVTQIVTAEISISAPGDVTMSANIPGMTGNENSPSTGTVSWTVITNNSTGFNMTLQAATSPAMQNSNDDSFANYTETDSATPDYTWDVSDGAAEFGYSVEPATAADTDASFLDNGSSACNTGATQTSEKCWIGFEGTAAETVINRSTETSASGETEVIKFQAEFNNNTSSAILASGTYTATITATATTN